MRCFGIELTINENKTKRIMADKIISFQLYTTNNGLICIEVNLSSEGKKENYYIKSIIPTDRIKIKFIENEFCDDMVKMDQNSFDIREISEYLIGSGKRLAIDIKLSNGDKRRCSHPISGSFWFMLSNAARKHFARVFMTAANKDEKWNWQFPDLKPGDEMELAIVETDWFDEAPSVTMK